MCGHLMRIITCYKVQKNESLYIHIRNIMKQVEYQLSHLRDGYFETFMAKLQSNLVGFSGHIHLSQASQVLRIIFMTVNIVKGFLK